MKKHRQQANTHSPPEAEHGTDENRFVNRRPIVAVIGASSASDEVTEMARQVGAAIGMQGWHLLTGGGAGVMEGACKGFVKNRRSNDAVCIGLLPSDDSGFANRFVEVAIPTGMGWARNAIIARTADALVAVAGCSGTLSEMAFAWQMGRPIAVLQGSGGWADKLGNTALDDRRDDVVFSARTTDELVGFLKEKLNRP